MNSPIQHLVQILDSAEALISSVRDPGDDSVLTRADELEAALAHLKDEFVDQIRQARWGNDLHKPEDFFNTPPAISKEEMLLECRHEAKKRRMEVRAVTYSTTGATKYKLISKQWGKTKSRYFKRLDSLLDYIKTQKVPNEL